MSSAPPVPDLRDGKCVHPSTCIYAAADCSDCIALVMAELDRLRAEVDRSQQWAGLAGCCSAEEMHANIGSLIDQLAAARADTERLDWLETAALGHKMATWVDRAWPPTQSLRAAIDAVRDAAKGETR